MRVELQFLPMTELCYHSLFLLHHGLVKSEILRRLKLDIRYEI